MRPKKGVDRAEALAASGATAPELRTVAAVLSDKARGAERFLLSSCGLVMSGATAANAFLCRAYWSEHFHWALLRVRSEGDTVAALAALRATPQSVRPAAAAALGTLATAALFGAASNRKQRAKLEKSFLEAATRLEAQAGPDILAVPVNC
ncbi:MAG TPA: hypothetical protein VEY30_02370 [Myxococcaceae bacterium]|nr:hypothetical protein [Myxococcaceae bacterium]